jgi:hypothetical protein
MTKCLISKTPLQLLTVITDRSRSKELRRLIKEQGLRINFISLAKGTAASEILEMLGLASLDKQMLCCIETSDRATYLMNELSNRLKLLRRGGGIAFTMPLSGVNAHILKALDGEIETANSDNPVRGEETMTCENSVQVKYELVVAVINQGFSERLMDAAKAAGAKGGTVLSALRAGTDQDSTFLGISIHVEKEIVAILVPCDMKNGVMSAISATCGPSTDAQGYVFSMPVNDVVGIVQK